MADDPELIDFETTILLLPPVSRGAHLVGPLLHAQRLVELWKGDANTDTAVPLALAFRLLDAEAIAGAISRAAATEEYSSRPSYWDLPSAEVLLAGLRELVWQAMLEGTLQVEAIEGVRGTRYRVLLPAELPRLTPDWGLSRLMLDGRDEFIGVRARRMPAEPVQRAWREPIAKADLKAAAEAIAQIYAGTQPSEEEFWGKLKDQTGRQDLTREEARKALDDYASHLRRAPGRPRRNNSPT